MQQQSTQRKRKVLLKTSRVICLIARAISKIFNVILNAVKNLNHMIFIKSVTIKKPSPLGTLRVKNLVSKRN